MESRISAADEKALTRAIEKAATIASVNDSLDRNIILAEQLKEASVDPRFAKVAAQAFNKRLTVLTFQKTADDQRHLPFVLSDPDVVSDMVGGVQTQTKQASVCDKTFVMRYEKRNDSMSKSASASYVRCNYEDSVDYKVLHRHVESMLDKQASSIGVLAGEIESLDSKIKTKTEAIASYFQKSACSSFEFNTLINKYGDAFVDAVKDYLPASTDYTKTASAAIVPNTGVYKEVADLLGDIEKLQEKKAFLEYYSKGIAQFCKAAGMFGNYIADTEYRGLHKQAAGMAAAAGNAVRGITMSGLITLNALNAARKAADEAIANNLSNAKQMYDKSRKDSIHAGEMIDSEFLVKDRFRDRMLSWSDMSADPQFAMYPAEQVFNATQKAMDADTALERPDMREALRAQVSQLLAQNNRYSTADIAALATMLKDKARSVGGAEKADAYVREIVSDTNAPEAVEIKNPAAYTSTYDPNKLIDMLQNDIKHVAEQSAKERSEEKSREEKERTAAAERVAKQQKDDADRLLREQTERARLVQNLAIQKARLAHEVYENMLDAYRHNNAFGVYNLPQAPTFRDAMDYVDRNYQLPTP